MELVRNHKGAFAFGIVAAAVVFIVGAVYIQSQTPVDVGPQVYTPTVATTTSKMLTPEEAKNLYNPDGSINSTALQEFLASSTNP